jgi:5'-3' exonuclease
MGIKDFYNVIKEHCPEILVTIHLSQLSGQKIAIDISIFLNKYVKSAGTEKWMDQFIILMCCLKKHGIKPVSIFDGPNPPIEKKQEQQRRRAEGAKTKEKIQFAKSIVKRLEKDYIPDEKDIDEQLKTDIKGVLARSASKVNFDDIYDVLSELKSSIAKKERQNLPILPEYTKIAKEIIEIMGFSHYQSPGEAETLCAGLCCAGMVDAVLSEDTDVMAYGTPFLLSKIDVGAEKVTIVSHEAILKATSFIPFQFRDLCILLSCDYNSRVKGYVPDGKKRKKPAPIGAKGAYIMMEEYETLEEAEKYMEDSDPLIYRRCRDLFTPPTKEELSHISIPYNKKIDSELLFDFIKRNKVRISVDYIMASWKPAEIEFVGCQEEEVLSDDEGSDVEDVFDYENLSTEDEGSDD